MEVFTSRLRAEIDLDTLSGELLAVVDKTREPTRVLFAATIGWEPAEATSPLTSYSVLLKGR
jgi:hypothetical protein